MSWSVPDEAAVYRHRDLAQVEFPELPTSATGKRSWDVATSVSIASIDSSSNDVLTRWFLLALNVVGDARVVVSNFHRNSQGLNMLDRHIGKLMAKPANLGHRMFGIQFGTYVEWCHRQGVAPRGRVFVALVSLRFRLDRSRGNVLNQVNLLNIPLPSFKLADVRSFVERVRLS